MSELMYDLHVATDAGGDSDELARRLTALGFQDDKLLQQGLIFPKDTARYYSSCPLIDIHMSKKLNKRSTQLEEKIGRLVQESDCAGYWHAEKTLWDAHIESSHSMKLLFPTFRLPSAQPRAQKKLWDLHIAILDTDLPADLREHLIGCGLYYLIRDKPIGPTAVYTVQGVNKVSEGFELARNLVWWLVLSGVPKFDFKFEITISMERVNNPQLVPPTIDHIEWL